MVVEFADGSRIQLNAVSNPHRPTTGEFVDVPVWMGGVDRYMVAV